MAENDDAIERLSKKLYSKNNDFKLQRSHLFQRGGDAPTAWKAPEEEASPVMAKPPSKIKPLELLFFSSAAFFVVALGVAALLFFGGNNTVSTKNVDIQIIGPTQIGAGSTLSLQIIVTNRNAVPMELTDLIVEFPPGTRSDRDVSVELPRVRESLGTIEPGESVNRTVRAAVFGIQGVDVSIKASAEFRVPSSNAVFVSEALYTARVTESPASITVNSLTEAVSGQVVSTTVTVTSNASEILSGMLLTASYPPGFTFISSSPAPLVGGGVWDLGDIEPGGTRSITINGTFSGEDGESRVMHFIAGNKKAGEETAIAAPLATSDMILTIQKPFISVELSLEGDTAQTHPIARGEEVQGTIRWTNNLPVRVQNVSIVLKLDGQILDRLKVKAVTGFFNSSSNSILWDKSTNNEFADVPPGAFGIEPFSFATLPAGQGTFKNAEIKLSAVVEGDRFSEGNVPESVQSSAAIRAVVLTDLGLQTSLAYTTGDTGPMPPKADTPTSYTVTWRVFNSGSAVANTRVSGTLPSYVSYNTVVMPSNENVSFNATGRQVSWNIGDLGAGQSRSVSFRVTLVPSTSQIGSPPVVIDDQEVAGVDRYARYAVQQQAASLSTEHVTGSPNGGIVTP